MSRIEVLEKWFFQSPVRRDGKIIAAPDVAVEKYVGLKNEWLIKHPKCPHERPIVSLFPGEENGQEGYFVRTGIMCK